MLHSLRLSDSRDVNFLFESVIHSFRFSASSSVSTNLFRTIFHSLSYIGILIVIRFLSFAMCSRNLGTSPSSYIVFHRNIICVAFVVHQRTSFNKNSKFLSIFFFESVLVIVSTSSKINKSGLNFQSGAVKFFHLGDVHKLIART